MQTLYFRLALSYERCEPLYLTSTQNVIVLADNGKRVQLPAKNLRPFIQHNGIHGRFRLIITDTNKISSLEKIV
ncbi:MULTISPECIES: DUF2835 family protein [Paraglaciecola]|jgi:hypothetical protein|uniref:DUF2835 domain-containing protein n=3 Tax=Paraglaciecola TaxID=1621534 RepID=K6YPF5_9ALTE|nr:MULTISPECIES: DUF2835 family protein [Paraglaciecola]AEE23202.1 Protein of unknown function DUF2835 [Glaciecola sp. 4H-3-7+YE-5]MAD18386.1 DUF2835 domain-containing protein [Alteromonadaceae bacterium]ABG40515.1 conserved hypothetical protein [Paraglaciecola sp. T6c]MBJ2135833.1 DUF2835 domain-containing protein [Paraglaciecola chathamensis]MBN26181.1 DUF2835 domain-containing protein [Alteromonadaceae bacterium]